MNFRRQPVTDESSREVGQVIEKPLSDSRARFLRKVKIFAVCVSVFILVAAIYNAFRWQGDFYLLPRTGDDWAAWAGWFGLVATTGAVIYAALQFQTDVDEKRTARARNDEDARKIPARLRIRVTPDSPIDKNHPKEQGNPKFVDGVTLYITNYGSESFENVQVKIPDLKAKSIFGKLGPEDIFRGHPFEEPAWTDMPSQPLLISEDQQLWSCGKLGPLTMMRLTIKFTEVLEDGRWDLLDPEDGVQGRIAVIFRDHLGHCWVRSTDDPKRLQRLWPESSIQERQTTSNSSDM